MRPGTQTTIGATALPSTAAVATNKAFVVIKTTSGAASGPPTKVLSLADHETKFGARGTTEIALGYDLLDGLFKKAGQKGDVFIVKRGASEAVVDALARIDATYGPGQVIVPTAVAGTDTAANAVAIGAHCSQYNRVGLVNGPKVATASDWAAIQATISADANARYLAPFGQWDTIPAIGGGSVRDVPHTAEVLADIMRLDATTGNPSVAAAGDEGRFGYAIAPSTVFTDAEITTLSALGVNCTRLDHDGWRTYGWYTAAPGTQWDLFSYARLAMAIRAQAEVIASQFLFRQIDGKGHLLGEFNDALTGMLLPFHTMGALFGDAPQDAFRVDTGAAANTPATIAAKELHAVISLRMSPFAEFVDITVTKRPITEEV